MNISIFMGNYIDDKHNSESPKTSDSELFLYIIK